MESPRLEAERLLAKACETGPSAQLYDAFDRALSDEQIEASTRTVVRRGRREPLDYILGEWGFRRLTLTADRAL